MEFDDTLMRLTLLEYTPDTEDTLKCEDYIVKHFDMCDGFIHIITDENIRMGFNTNDISRYVLSYDEVE